VVRDRSAARPHLLELVRGGGPTAGLAHRELTQFDQQQIAPAVGQTAHVLPQLSVDAPADQREGQRETSVAKYRLVAEAHTLLTNIKLDDDALWRVIARLVKVAFPNDPELSAQALRATYLPRGELAIAR
jgi:hypothetical protein